jgi:hypothetical protein
LQVYNSSRALKQSRLELKAQIVSMPIGSREVKTAIISSIIILPLFSINRQHGLLSAS